MHNAIRYFWSNRTFDITFLVLPIFSHIFHLIQRPSQNNSLSSKRLCIFLCKYLSVVGSLLQTIFVFSCKLTCIFNKSLNKRQCKTRHWYLISLCVNVGTINHMKLFQTQAITWNLFKQRLTDHNYSTAQPAMWINIFSWFYKSQDSPIISFYNKIFHASEWNPQYVQFVIPVALNSEKNAMCRG